MSHLTLKTLSFPRSQRGHRRPRTSATILAAMTACGVLLLIMQAGAAPGDAAATGGAAGSTGTTAPDLAVALAPFVALSAAIERFWEVVFNWIESAALATGRVLGAGAGSAQWMKRELENAQSKVAALATSLDTSAAGLLGQQGDGQGDGKSSYDETLQKLQQAETRLLDAQTRIAESLKSPNYVAWKRAITLGGSLIIGLIIGIVFASSGNPGLLHAAGFSAVPRGFDAITTGLLVGSGTGPLHSFIGTLQELRNALAGLADLARGSAIKKAVESLQTAAGQAGALAPGSPEPKDDVSNTESMRLSPTDRARLPSTESARLPSTERTVGDAQRLAVERLQVQRQAERLLRLR